MHFRTRFALSSYIIGVNSSEFLGYKLNFAALFCCFGNNTYFSLADLIPVLEEKGLEKLSAYSCPCTYHVSKSF